MDYVPVKNEDDEVISNKRFLTIDFNEDAVLPDNLSEKVFTSDNLFGLKKMNFGFETKIFEDEANNQYELVVISFFK